MVRPTPFWDYTPLLVSMPIDNTTGPIVQFTGIASTGANNTVEQSFTSWPCEAGDYGMLIPTFTAVNAVKPLYWYCTTTGTCVVAFCNATGGILTCQQADSTHVYKLITFPK